MAAGREPWIKLKIGTRRSDKLAGLSDNAWRGWIYVLLEAKVQRRMGVFAGRAHLVDLLGSYGQHVDAWVGAGLLHIAPALCAECSARHAHDELKAGDVVVHDYLLEQRDPTNAERQEAFRAKQRAEREAADVTPPSVTTPSPAPVAVTKPSVTPSPADLNNDDVTPLSRARGTTATATVTVTETTKKNVSDEEVDEANAVSTREAVDDRAFLSDPNRAGRRGASSGSSVAAPPAIAKLTPQWRHPCTDYVRHTSRHRLVDGVAVCDACEEQLAIAAKPNGADVGAQDGFGLA